jgi:glycosyltransferase 2 family protein
VRVPRIARISLMGLGVTLIAAYFIASQINGALFLHALQTARYAYVLPCILFLAIGLFTRARRWQTLLNYKLPLLRTFHIMNIGYLVNGVLPLRIGDVARLYLYARTEAMNEKSKRSSDKTKRDEENSTSKGMLTAAGSVLIERLLDLLAVVVMTMLALAFAPVPAELQAAASVGFVSAVVGFAALLIFAVNRPLLHRILAFVQRLIPFLQRFNLATWLDHLLDGLLPLTQPRLLAAALLWTALSWIFSVMAGYFLMFAFFDIGSVAATALYVSAAAFAIALPAVPGNVGPYEAAILLALKAMGYQQTESALAFAVMVHAVNVFVHASTGVLGFIQEGLSLQQLQTGVRQWQTVSSKQGDA